MPRVALRRLFLAALLAVAVASCATARNLPVQATPLSLDVFTAPANSYGVTSVIVYGPTEAVVIDAQFRRVDAERLADRIEALDRRVTAIFVTHPDTDHVVGLGALRDRFPDTPIYMTAAGVQAYRDTIEDVRTQMSRNSARAHEAPPVEPIAVALPGRSLTVDGHTIEVIADLQGDAAIAPVNSVVWIPSLRALLASDMAFQDTHVFLQDSTPQTRAAWLAALARLEAMNASVVVAGHKRDAAAPDTPASLSQTRAYLETFERRLRESADAPALEAAMRADYPDFAFPIFLTVSARSLYAPPE